jgi:hypothetical protein
MPLRLITAFVACLACLLPAALVAQEARVSVRPTTIYLGEPFEYRLTLVDASDAEVGDFQPEGFATELRSEPVLQRSLMTINGQRSQSESKVYSYLMTANNAGRFKIQPPSISLNGEAIDAREVEIEVIGPEQSPLFNLTVKSDKISVYPLQRFNVQLDVNLRELDPPYRLVSPVSRVRPSLLVPWLQEESIADGLQSDPFDFNGILRADGSGFRINGMRSRGLFQDREYSFLPAEEKFQTKDEDSGEEVTWFRYRFRRNFTAIKPGTYSLGRASLRGELLKIEEGRVTTATVFGVTEPVSIKVKPLPLDGRPDSWCGVIGNLDVESTITPVSARVGEPLTLTLTLSGSGLLTDAFPPELADDPDIAKTFKVYDATSRPTNIGRTFTYSLRAKEAGDIEFPPVELAWFDPDREEYVAGKTSPISLTVTEAKVLSADAIVGKTETKSGPIQATTGGLAANLPSLEVVRFRPKPWFIAWGGITLATGLLWLVSGRNISVKQKAKAKRKHRLAVANAKVSESLKQLGANQVAEGITALREAINSIVAAVCDSEDGGLTSEEVVARLNTSGIDQKAIQQTSELLETLDAARYGGLAGSADELQTRVQSTVGDLIKSANKVRP